MSRVPVMIDGDHANRLRAIRDAEGIPISVQVRRAIEAWIEERERELERGNKRIHKVLRGQRLDRGREQGTHTSVDWSEILAECYHRCVRCGAEDVALEKDHIIPLYQGGSDGPENLQPLCGPCNRQKGPERKNWREHRQHHGWEDR